MDVVNKIGLIGASIAMPLGIQAAEKPKPARPNIIVILTDDMGYSDLGCYGGEIMTPNIDGLASNGLRWAQFYNNARSCPSRAVLMTGLYPHQAGMGWMAAADMQTPEYQGYLNDNCVTIAEVLGQSGYETYMVGKWHLCSDRQCKGNVTEHWPMARGFNHYYGHPEGASNYFHAKLVDGEERLPETGDGFYLTDAITDTAASYITRHDYKDKPLFLYLAFNAPHWPLHALQEDIDKYKGKYDVGWDSLRVQRFKKQKAMGLFSEDVELSPRDSRVPAWNSLTDDQKKEYSMRMTIYAAQIAAIDRGVGKVIKALEDAGEFNNTVIMMMDDNGACAERLGTDGIANVTGKAETWESYRINWANLSSTPYREYKHYTNEGGIASPLIVSWPNGINSQLDGSFIREYGYFADIMATCVDIAGAKYPSVYKGHKITPCEGVSLVPNFSNKPTGRGMTFWEHEVNIAVRDGKWKLNIHHVENEPINLSKLELYDMEKDPTELHNLASSDTAKANSMLRAWEKWAARVHAYPLSTDGYGKRQQAYRRVINGEFDDNFGGWTLSENPSVSYSIDKKHTISGEKTAMITVSQTGAKPSDSFMKWDFPTTGEAHGTISFSYKTDKTNKVWVRMERANKAAEKALSKEVELTKEGSVSLPFVIDKGRWQLALYFGNSNPGNIWLDNVKLDLDSNGK